MPTIFEVELKKIVKKFSLEKIYIPKSEKPIVITSLEVNRPGLELAGFFDYFDNTRVQILGKTETAYLEQFSSEQVAEKMERLMERKPVAVIITRNIAILPEMLSAAIKHNVPLLRTSDWTSSFMAALISDLNVELAPRITTHGVLVEVYGEGLLLLGESGVGKSETAIELVKRGHRLIADDAVEIRRVSNRTLVGTAPENIRHFVELRGIGIINARRIFGMGSVKMTEKVDLVIQMELWNPDKLYDRMGTDENFYEILGSKIPTITIPVKPGRNLAVIIEVAAMNNRQKKMGFNATNELLQKLGMVEDIRDGDVPEDGWDSY